VVFSAYPGFFSINEIKNFPKTPIRSAENFGAYALLISSKQGYGSG
jgi:hypothetical protein